jgi:hypothetical protein
MDLILVLIEVVSEQLPIPRTQICLSARTGYHSGNQCEISECSPSDVALKVLYYWNAAISKEN